MSAMTSERDGDEGARIEALLGELRATSDPTTAARIDELVARLVELYGAGLARIVERLDHAARVRIAKDKLVSSLLVLHGLHPDDVLVRVEEALLRAGAGAASLLAIDARGVARVRLEGGPHDATGGLRDALERAVREAAPEVARVEIVGEGDQDAERARSGSSSSSTFAPPPAAETIA
jgi:hypothetical protein